MHAANVKFYFPKSTQFDENIYISVDREIFTFKYFRVINVRVSNFHHKVQNLIIHGVFYFRVLNFRRP